MPGDVAVGVEEFGGGADQVGDDGIELPVDPFLRSVAQRGPFGLADRAEAAGFPLPRARTAIDRRRGVRQQFGVGFFGEDDAVPDEVDLLCDGRSVGGESLFGGTSAQWVVTVAPVLAVGGGDGDEAVVGIPGVAPGPGLGRQALLLAQGEPALGVVFVADVASPADQGAGVLAFAAGAGFRWVGLWGGPGRVGDVAGWVVVVAFGPPGTVDGGDLP